MVPIMGFTAFAIDIGYIAMVRSQLNVATDGGALGAALALQSWQSGAQQGPVVVNSLSLGGTNFSVVLAPYGE